MNNIFENAVCNERIVKYDLKGSTFDRYLKVQKYHIGEPFKDFDFI